MHADLQVATVEEVYNRLCRNCYTRLMQHTNSEKAGQAKACRNDRRAQSKQQQKPDSLQMTAPAENLMMDGGSSRIQMMAAAEKKLKTFLFFHRYEVTSPSQKLVIHIQNDDALDLGRLQPC
ncbi:GL18073 [Drosophila persimilis]|uniref:GL18073 n=1 Tax=Drosophila persimilis TaxID=7234 RepID=B4HD60_DROPE|nr:GL18073 [Drosophila persimilis]